MSIQLCQQIIETKLYFRGETVPLTVIEYSTLSADNWKKTEFFFLDTFPPNLSSCNIIYYIILYILYIISLLLQFPCKELAEIFKVETGTNTLVSYFEINITKILNETTKLCFLFSRNFLVLILNKLKSAGIQNIVNRVGLYFNL